MRPVKPHTGRLAYRLGYTGGAFSFLARLSSLVDCLDIRHRPARRL